MIVNPIPKPTVRTMYIAKIIYDRKTSGETLEQIRETFGYTRIHCSRLFNWYKTWVLPAAKGDDLPSVNPFKKLFKKGGSK